MSGYNEIGAMNFANLSDDEKSEQVAAKTIWQPEIECKLL